MKTNEFAQKIALAGLGIGAIELCPTKPRLWASGTYNPIYNDNRMLLGSYAHRMLVKEGFKDLLKRNNLQADIICGTSLSGIAPAASLADDLLKPLVIADDYKLYYTASYPKDRMEIKEDAGIVIANSPWVIRIGIDKANKFQLPFAYMRPEQKNHGKQQIIEGIVKPGQIAYMVCAGAYNTTEIGYILSDKGIENVSAADSIGILDFNHPAPDLSGKSVIVIEDLISTGESTLKEVNACRAVGANVIGVFSIFNYGLDSAKKKFEEARCPVYSILSYDELIDTAEQQEMFTTSDLEMLRLWRTDQPNWGSAHGFPSVKKEKMSV